METMNTNETEFFEEAQRVNAGFDQFEMDMSLAPSF